MRFTRRNTLQTQQQDGGIDSQELKHSLELAHRRILHLEGTLHDANKTIASQATELELIKRKVGQTVDRLNGVIRDI